MSVNRRDVLRLSIASYIATLTSPTSARDMSGTKVIVIGAGVAGLAAAQQLKANGAQVVVLEAGNYVGGRVRTDMSLGAPFEHGAGWIHGPSRRNPTQQLAKQIDAPTFVTDDDSLDVFGPDGRPLTETEYQRLDRLYAELEDTLYHPQRPGQQSVLQMLEQSDPDILRDPAARWMLSAFFEFSVGGGIDDISAAHGFETRAFPGADVILPEGYDKIFAPLASGLDIRLNTQVSKVSYDDNGVTVAGERADFAVCTASLGVLKSGQIAFDPSLPHDLQDAIEHVGFGSVTKIALKFTEPFWDVDTQYFGIMTKPDGRWNYWMNYRTFSDENILLGVSVGHYAPIADQMGKTDMTRDALDVLRSVWGTSVGTPHQVLTTHWSQDPHFLGAYSYPQAGGSIAQFKEFEKPIAGRLFFAGEHTGFDYSGTTHGALMSGHRAAEDILAL